MQTKSLFLPLVMVMFTLKLTASGVYPAFELKMLESDTQTTYSAEEFNAEAERIVCTLDSMMSMMYSGYKAGQEGNVFGFDSATIPFYPDSVLEVWMRQLPVVMPFVYNVRTKRFIELYAYQRRAQVSNMLALGETYFPIFEDALEKRGMPHELKYLPVVESALNNNAVSRAGATGIWQIMYPTGRMLGLTINSVIDERRDPYKATHAALDYLENLYGIYDDWLLALAAYNCGPGNLNRAIRRSGNKRNYWELLPYLPRETRGYVPAFVGAAYVMENHKLFNISLVRPERDWAIADTMVITEKISFSLLSEKLGITEETLAYLNPAYRRGFIPASRDGHVLKMPIEFIAAFEAQADTLFAMEKAAEPVSPDPVTTAAPAQRAAIPANSARIHYTVKDGDNLGFIAEWYNVKIQEVRDWNNFSGNIIRVGQRLTIYVPEAEAEQYRKINDMAFAQKQSMVASRRPSQTPAISLNPEDCNCELYKVQSGDTLWEISRKYPGVSVNDLLQVNNLSNSRSLRPGMVMKIKQP